VPPAERSTKRRLAVCQVVQFLRLGLLLLLRGLPRSSWRLWGWRRILPLQIAQTIAVTLHELATNAVKYGALSTAKGHVQVNWSLALDGRIVLRWTETGSPPVKPPRRPRAAIHLMVSTSALLKRFMSLGNSVSSIGRWS